MLTTMLISLTLAVMLYVLARTLAEVYDDRIERREYRFWIGGLVAMSILCALVFAVAAVAWLVVQINS